MKEKLYQFAITVANRPFLSATLHRFARSKWSRPFISTFAQYFKINKEEMEKPIIEYGTLHEFFTRKLKEGARTIAEEEAVVTSPVDGVIEEYGTINETTQFHVKGRTYDVKEMLGKTERLERFNGGSYIVIYLSPSHYHRIHSPVTGVVTNQYSLGGRSFPVNQHGMTLGKDPLSKNYRIVTEVKSEYGETAIVKVGAMFVNSIEVVHEGDQLEKGQDFAYFSFGSTVVLVFEKDTFNMRSDFGAIYHVKMGEKLGEWNV